MRKLLVLAMIGLLAVPALDAQQQWRAEVGLQGGFARIKTAGTGANDRTDLFDVPGFNISPSRSSYATVFAIIPWKPKLAIEPSFAVSQIQQALNTTLADIGLRLDYALSRKFYGAAGATLSHVSGSVEASQLGVLAAVGYRMRLSGTLRGRVEARVNLLGKTDRIGPRDVYALLFGLSATTGGTTEPPRREAPGRGAWQRAIGASGGYSQLHGVRSGAANDNVTVLAFPGFGGGFGASGSRQVVVPPTLFATFPLGDKFAIEPGFDFHRTQQAGPGNTTLASANLSARLDYAIHRGWYAGAGFNANYEKFTGTPAFARPGANVAAGYRFPLAGDLRGRVELSHIMFKARDTNPKIRAINVTSLTIGVMVPLK